jgi:phosphotriesterase-related protein
MTLADRLPEGQVVTATGPVDPSAVGRVMMHEHVLLDIRKFFGYAPAAHFDYRLKAVDGPVTLDKLGVLRQDPGINRHNLILEEEELAVIELQELAAAGGGAVVEMSSLGLGGNRAQLPVISASSGVKIIVGAGFYLETTLPEDVRAANEDEIRRRLLSELARDEVIAGVIGEMGTSDPMTPGEAMRLSVAASVAAELGLSLHVHLQTGARSGVDAAEIVLEHLEPERLVLAHVDSEADPDYGYIGALADTGAILSLDTFGSEHHIESLNWVEPRDLTRMETLLWLINRGHGNRLVVSHDVCMKTMLRTYGGFGYDHFLRDVVPQLRQRGIEEDVLTQMLVSTPQRVLTIKSA